MTGSFTLMTSYRDLVHSCRIRAVKTRRKFDNRESGAKLKPGGGVAQYTKVLCDRGLLDVGDRTDRSQKMFVSAYIF